MHETYENPLITRYASRAMAENFSDHKKFSTWRKLWIALAEAEKELGLSISDEQIEQLKSFASNINYAVAEKKEQEVRHDVMAHMYAYGEQCPLAKPIIHLGATSCFVGDNTDIVVMRDGLHIIKQKLVNTISGLKTFASRYQSTPTLGFTHFQPAQLTTVGKRATLWMQDLVMDYEDLVYQVNQIKFLGVKGTTGTQASFLTLFEGNHAKVLDLEEKVAQKMGYEKYFEVTGQTYPRKLDAQILNVLSGIAQSAAKFSNDIRLLQNLKEIEEPFEKAQIGSSAMAYKRNPMRCERIASLARFVLSCASSPAMTASSQWLERTLDDSANKRLVIPQAFLAVDAVLSIYMNVVDGLVVYPNMIQKHINAELPFMATETILMEAVKRGGDRQILHEKIRVHSMEAGKRVKVDGEDNDLIARISEDTSFNMSKDEIAQIMDAKNFIGRAPEQVSEFIKTTIDPILQQNNHLLGQKAELHI